MKKIDFSKLPTEKTNPRSKNIDRLSVAQILDVVNREDRSVPLAVAAVKPEMTRAINLIVMSLSNGGRLFFAGAGTSGRLGVIEAAECPPTFSTPPSLVQAVIAGGRRAVFRSQEGAEDNREAGEKIFLKKLRAQDVLVGIAASGVTPFVAGALEAAHTRGAKKILITCHAASPLKNRVDCLIAPVVGPEIISGSTRLKAGTATKLVLNMLTVASMTRLGKVYQNWMVDLSPKSKKLRARALGLVKNLGGVDTKSAQQCLRRARNQVKLAILMARTGLNYEAASRKLKKASGYLEAALAQ